MSDITIGYKIKGDSLELDSISTGMFNTLKQNDLNKDESLLIGSKNKTLNKIKEKLKGINKIKSVLFGKELSDNVETPSITNDVAPNDLSPEESVPTEQIGSIPFSGDENESSSTSEELQNSSTNNSLINTFGNSAQAVSNGLGYGIGAIGDTINSGVSTVSNGLTGVVNMGDNKKPNIEEKNDDISDQSNTEEDNNTQVVTVKGRATESAKRLEPLHSRRVGGRKTKKNKGGKKFIKKTKRYINSKTHKNKQNIQNKTIKRLVN